MIKYTVEVHSNGNRFWYLNVQLHREDGPACEWADGSKEWWLNGKRHRVDGPAIERACGRKFWYQNGQLHRADGPACEWADSSKEWFLHGKEYTEQEFLELTQPAKDMTVAELEKILGYRVRVVKG